MTSNVETSNFADPTLVLVPCFAGAAWDVGAIAPLNGRDVLAPTLPDDIDSVDGYADFLADLVAPLDRYVLVGDSFGAVVALALAVRNPSGLEAMVLSGGFAADPLPTWKALACRTAHLVPGPLYRHGTLRFHAWQLSSVFDKSGEAEVPHTMGDYREFFVHNTPLAAYSARVTSVLGIDLRTELSEVTVPTLVLTPGDDRIIGDQAATDLVNGLPNATEQVLGRTGHMFRFTHPTRYGTAIADFVDREILAKSVAV